MAVVAYTAYYLGNGLRASCVGSPFTNPEESPTQKGSSLEPWTLVAVWRFLEGIWTHLAGANRILGRKAPWCGILGWKWNCVDTYRNWPSELLQVVCLFQRSGFPEWGNLLHWVAAGAFRWSCRAVLGAGTFQFHTFSSNRKCHIWHRDTEDDVWYSLGGLLELHTRLSWVMSASCFELWLDPSLSLITTGSPGLKLSSYSALQLPGAHDSYQISVNQQELKEHQNDVTFRRIMCLLSPNVALWRQ